METRNTVMMILVTTILALGLTVYGESVEKKEKMEVGVLRENSQRNYKSLQIDKEK